MDLNEALSIFEMKLDSSIEDIEKSYKKLAMKFHPDKGGTDEEMSKLNEAKAILEKELSSKNVPAVIKQFEIALREVNTAAQTQKNVEKRAAKLESDIHKTATNRLKSWRQVALFFTAISTICLFFGKDIPKELLSSFHEEEITINKPEKIEKPIKPIFDSMRIDTLPNEQGDQETKPKYTPEQINQIKVYEEKEVEYQKYLTSKNKYEDALRENILIKKHNKDITYMWYMFVFTVIAYSGAIAWFYNRKISRVENEISELDEEMAIKSQFAIMLVNVFGNSMPDQWTLKELELALLNNGANSRSIDLILHAVGERKFAQLLVIKGQELAHLNVENGCVKNNYEESYSIS